MLKILEGSRAVAETIRLIKPKVISAYPITPQTHIVEELAQFKADGELETEYVLAESEFAAASICEGASATGVRVYTATSSQGLLLMTEVLFNIAGMRLPVILTCANRAVSAPINIWNDQQDSLTIRDAGWLMFYAENNQEVCDLHLVAYQIAESLNLPAMVNMDGYVLTHTQEPVNIPSQAQVNKFLPAFRPQVYLNPKKPFTFGAFATPEDYMGIRKNLHDDLMAAKNKIKKAGAEFKKIFARNLSTLIEEYKTKDAQIVFVAMGSVVGTIKEAVDEFRKKGQKVGVLKIVCFRPFPEEEIRKALSKAKYVAVVDKSISFGTEGILAAELKRILFHQTKTQVKSFILGLGGKDITIETVKKVVGKAKKSGKQEEMFVFG